MNVINSNYNVNYFSNTVNNINSVDNNISLEENSKETNNKDSIEISQKNQNIINTKKALDIFHEVSSEYPSIQINSNGDTQDLSCFYGLANEMMKDAGIDVPSFVLDGSNTVDFISHAEKLKEFVKKLNIERPGSFPDELLDFCDSFKERLIQYGCK